MFDIIIEIIRAVLTGFILYYLQTRLKATGLNRITGWRLISMGFGFLFLASLLDITDNIPGLERYVVIGDTVPQAILEKVFGYLTSSVLILAGFIKLIPLNSDLLATQNKLRASEGRYRNLVESVNSVILRWDHRGRVIYMNDFGKNLFGFPGDELIGAHVVGTIVPEIDSRGNNLREKIEDVIRHTEKYVLSENENICRDGRRLHIQWSNRALYDDRGTLLEILSVGTDITRSKQLAEELRQAQKLEALGTLAGGIAHDFNNILSGILGYSELALLESGKNSRLEKFLHQINNAALRARNLVRQILMFSRKSHEEKKPIRLGGVIDEALELLRSTIPTTVTIEKQLKGDPVIVADHNQIHQVLMNLCTNASHALPDHKGTLTVRLTEIDHLPPEHAHRAGDDKQGKYALLEVQDNGQGMDQETIEKIFDPYFSTKDKDKGTGLGLAVVHGIIKGHGGEISVNSALGRGTTFRIFLPVSEAKKNSSSEKQPNRTIDLPGKGETVLFVDDEEHIRELAREFLQLGGYTPMLCDNGNEAMKRLRSNSNHIDLLVTDMTMPGMTGSELIQQAKQLRPDLPVILCTGYTDSLQPDEIRGLGAESFLQKPFSFSQLLEQISSLTSRPRRSSPFPGPHSP